MQVTMKTQSSRVLVIGDNRAATNTVFTGLHRHGHRLDRAIDLCNPFGRELPEYAAIMI